MTYSLFTNRGRLAASARCAQPFLCRRDVSGSDERGHLCGETSLFTPCLSVALTAAVFISQEKMIVLVQSGAGQ